MESSGQNRNLQGISPEIVNLALQNGIIPSTLNAATLPTASLDITCPGQTPSTSFGAIVSNHSLNVPFFESDAFKNVNLNVAPSSLLNGLDLPTDDVTTLRFFYNLGVQSLRNYQCITNSSSLPHVTQCVSTTANQISLGSLQNEQQAKMLQEYRDRHLASQQAIRDLQSQLLKNSEVSTPPGGNQHLPLLYQSPNIPSATHQPDSLLLQNPLMNSSVDWLAFNELVLRARMFTAALDMVPTVQNEVYNSQICSEKTFQGTSTDQSLRTYDQPVSSLNSVDVVGTSSNYSAQQSRLTTDSVKISEKSTEPGSQTVKLAAEKLSSPIAQPLPIKPKLNSHEAVYDIQVNHSLLAASEKHYNETFKNSQSSAKNLSNCQADTSVQQSPNSETVSSGEPEPQVSPQLLITLINTYLSKVKKQLYNKGVGLHLDSHGLPIDFSARPVDPIFRIAREQLDSIREYRDAGSSLQNHIAVDLNRHSSPSLKETEIVESATERLQQSAFRERDTVTGVNVELTKNSISEKSGSQLPAFERNFSEGAKNAEDKLNTNSPSNTANDSEKKFRYAGGNVDICVPPEKRLRTDSSENK